MTQMPGPARIEAEQEHDRRNMRVALRMAKRLIREAQHARLESVLELSAAFQAIAHNTRDHAERITEAVARLGPRTA